MIGKLVIVEASSDFALKFNEFPRVFWRNGAQISMVDM